MSSGLGFGKRKLIDEIIKQNWGVRDPREKKDYSYTELLFIIQEMLTEEGRFYAEGQNINRGFEVFRNFAKMLVYRNLANYDTMVLITSEKGCITGDALLEMPRDLNKYPKGIPLKKLVNKGPLHIYSFNKENKKLELKKCDGVQFVKNDHVWEIELTNGAKIQATKDHPFLQMNGDYKQLKDLIYRNHVKVPQKIYCKESGRMVKTDRLRIITRPHTLDLNDNRIKIDYNDIDKKNGDSALKHNKIEHRFIMEQLGYDIENKIVHHINNNHADNNISNLKVMTPKEHFYEHNMDRFAFQEKNIFCHNTGYSTKKKQKITRYCNEFKKIHSNIRTNFCINNIKYISELSKEREKNNNNSNHIKHGGVIQNIKYIGKKDVYDVINVQDNKNFIVNGFVVSNSGKSSFAMMLAREICKIIGIKFDPERHMAYNNAEVSKKIDTLNAFEPLVCDEAVRFACLDGETNIYTREGTLKIKDLAGKKDFEVLSYDEKKHLYSYKKAKKCIPTKIDYVYELETIKGKKIRCTKEHKFLTKDGWKELQELKEGDDIIGL